MTLDEIGLSYHLGKEKPGLSRMPIESKASEAGGYPRLRANAEETAASFNW
jgi:hypothetical protein